MKVLGCFLLCAFLLPCSLAASADERISVCYNYGCLTQAEVVYGEEQLRALGVLLRAANDAAEEREAIGAVVGRMLGWAGQQSAISADRGGNYADDAVYGKMDCIDHSTTTTRLLRLMERKEWLHYHRVLDPVLRRRFLILDHFSAQIEEVQKSEEAGPAERFVVDSWFFDNGQPAVVMPLALWRAGESPDGYE